MRREVTFAALSSVVGCAAPIAEDVEADAYQPPRAIVLGVDDSVEVQTDGANLPRELAAQMGAVGRATGLACTGTHIGDRLVLTAGHCVIADSHEHCAATAFEWRVGGDRPPVVGRCVRLRYLAFSAQGDLALVEVDRAPAVAARVDACRAVAPGDEVSLLGHPEGGPLRWTGYCPLVADTSEHVMQSIGHHCDTKDGSSGSPLFHRASGAVVGVHLGLGGADFNRALALAPYAHELAWRCRAGESSVRASERSASP